MSSSPDFSIILPVCHGGTLLRAAVESLWRIDYPPDAFEVIVAGRGEVVASDAPCPLRTIPVDSANRSAILNAACAAARGRWLAFADDDCVFRPDWLRTIRAVADREPGAGMIGGPDELEPGASAFDLALDAVLNSFWGTGGLRRGEGVRVGRYYPRLWNMAMPRDVVAAMLPRLFDEGLDIHEDAELAERVRESGRKIIFAPELRIGHRRDTSFLSFVRRNFKMAQIAGRLRLHRLAHAALAGFVLGVPMLAVAAWWSGAARVLLLALAVAYGTVLAGAALAAFLRERRLKVLAIVPALLVSLHVTRGMGYLAGIMGARRRTGLS